MKQVICSLGLAFNYTVMMTGNNYSFYTQKVDKNHRGISVGYTGLLSHDNEKML